VSNLTTMKVAYWMNVSESSGTGSAGCRGNSCCYMDMSWCCVAELF